MVEASWIESILKLVERFGLSLVLLIAIIFWLRPKLDQMWELIMDLKKANQPHETVEDVVMMNTCIRSVLQDMMADFRSDWCHLWQFHNGIRSMGTRGLPFLYITLTHEVKRTGLPTLIPAFEHIPLSMFDDFAVNLIDGDVIEYRKGNDCDDKMNQLLFEYGMKQIILRAVRDEDGSVVAFISCMWNEERDLTEKDKNMFRSYAQRMSATLAKLPDAVLIKTS